MNDEFSDIISLVDSFKEYQKTIAPIIISNANMIISKKITNPLEIEMTLENLASMIDLKGIKATFTKLYNYYESMYPVDAKYALNCYKEIYDIKDDELVLKRGRKWKDYKSI